jgi:hypothetical protein
MYKYCVCFYINYDEYRAGAEFFTSEPIINVNDNCITTYEGDIKFSGTIAEISLITDGHEVINKTVFEGEER